MARYKSIKFNLMDGVSNKEFIDLKNTNEFNHTFLMDIDDFTKRLKMAKSYENTQEFTGDYGAINRNYIAVHGSSSVAVMYYLSSNGVDVPELYRKVGTSSFTSLFTFPVGTTYGYAIIAFKGWAVAITRNTTLFLSYSTDAGISFTHTAWPYGKYIKHLIGSDGYLYIVDDTGSVMRSTNLLDWEIYYDGASLGNKVIDIEELDGFIYFIVQTDNVNINHFCKFASGELDFLKTFDDYPYASSMVKLNDKIYLVNIYNGAILVYKYDRSDVEFFARDDYAVYQNVKLIFADRFNAYFSAGTASTSSQVLLKMNENGGIFIIKVFETNDKISNMVSFDGTNYIAVYNSAGVIIYDDSGTSYEMSGEIVYPMLNFPHKPCYIITRHRKLPSGISYLLSAAVDMSATYSTALGNNTEDDSIGEVFDIKSVGKVEYFSLLLNVFGKGTLLSDIEVEYLYIDLGLQNSK